MQGLFVTGTDTGVGKTIVSAALLAAIAASGRSPRAYKPVVTGLDDLSAPGPHAWPADHELLGAAAGIDPAVVSPLSYGPAVSPHLAAQLAGEHITLELLIEGARAALGGPPALSAGDGPATQAGDPVIVEGVGGLLTPFEEGCSVRDLAVALGLPVLIAARPGLGTINHTLLTLEAARDSGLQVQAIVLTPWPEHPERLELSNRETIASIGDVEVATLGLVRGPGTEELARAGETLPWRRWLA